jgi:shikimate kinase
MKKVILIGYMASGKTTVAKIMSSKLGVSYFDLDFLIENETKLSVSTLFSEKGEIYFRKVEHTLFKSLLLSNQSAIISTGGGTPCYANNHLLLNGPNVISVYLSGSIDLLYKRLLGENNQRPLVANKTDEEMKDFIAKHLFERSYYYNQATFKVAIDDKSPEDIALEIIKLLV